MSPRVSAVLELLSEMTDEERKDLRLQLELDEGATARGRKAPTVSKVILDELERRFISDRGPGVSPEVAMKRVLGRAKQRQLKKAK